MSPYEPIYGVSAATQALPSVQEFNRAWRAAERQVNPPVVEQDDGTCLPLPQWLALAPFRTLPENIDDLVGMDDPRRPPRHQTCPSCGNVKCRC